MLYLAIEPYARRFWPDGLLGWTRLLSGRLLDPRVGRDILIGLTFAALGLVLELARLLPPALGQRAPVPPFGGAFSAIMQPPLLLAQWLGWFHVSVESALGVAMVFVVARLVLKRAWQALVAGIIVVVLVSDNGRALSGSWTDTAIVTALVTLLSVAVYRYGLLALVVSLFVGNVINNVPLTLNPSAVVGVGVESHADPVRRAGRFRLLRRESRPAAVVGGGEGRATASEVELGAHPDQPRRQD